MIKLFGKSIHESSTCSVLLEWADKDFGIKKTAVSVYYVERRSDTTAFTFIEKIVDPALFNLFVDPDPLAGNSYYRLKIVDQNGYVFFSNIISIVFKKEQNYKIVRSK